MNLEQVLHFGHCHRNRSVMDADGSAGYGLANVPLVNPPRIYRKTLCVLAVQMLALQDPAINP